MQAEFNLFPLFGVRRSVPAALSALDLTRVHRGRFKQHAAKVTWELAAAGVAHADALPADARRLLGL